MVQKKGQVTLYIVIALIILIAGILFFTIRPDEKLIDKEKIIRQVPKSFQPVYVFVDECVKTVSKEAIEVLGRQGGFISLTDPTVSDHVFQFQGDATESDGVSFSPQINIPYWYYLKSKNTCYDCSFETRVPDKEIIEKGIEYYLVQHLPSCIDKLRPFLEQGFSFEIDDPKPTVKVLQKEVIVSVDYPIKGTQNDQVVELDSFGTTHDISLPHIIDLGKVLLYHQVNNSFLEYNTMNFVAAYGAVDSDKLPPIAAEDIGPQKTIWVVPTVQRKIQDILSTYIQGISVIGTNNYYPLVIPPRKGPGYEVRQGMLSSLVFNLAEDDTSLEYEDLDVSFLYLDWPIYFDITPRDGQLIRPEELTQDFSPFYKLFAQSYNFYYDISYPVVIEIRQPDAFKYQGYSFWFALETNIRNNKPLKPGHFEEFSEFDLGAKSLLSLETQKLSGPVRITVRDELFQPIPDVYVSYQCGDDSAALGSTNLSGKVTESLPLCIGGQLKLQKEGWVAEPALLNTSMNEPVNVDARMQRLYKKNVTLYIRYPGLIELTNQRKVTIEEVKQYTTPIQGEDSAFATFTLIGPHGEEVHKQAVAFDGNNPTTEIELAAGVYEIQGQFIDAEGFYLPEKKQNVGGQTVTIPEMEIKPAPLGGVVLTNETQYWLTQRSFLQDPNSHLSMYMFKAPTPSSHEQLDVMNSALNYSIIYTPYIIPKWRS